jgi:hypothetical protein
VDSEWLSAVPGHPPYFQMLRRLGSSREFDNVPWQRYGKQCIRRIARFRMGETARAFCHILTQASVGKIVRVRADLFFIGTSLIECASIQRDVHPSRRGVHPDVALKKGALGYGRGFVCDMRSNW